jgi:hypothetical protein
MIDPRSTRRSPARFVMQIVLALALSPALTSALAQAPAGAVPDAAPGTAPAAAPGTASVPPADSAAPANPTSILEPFAWLHGCWDGNVNGRAFREEWLPLRGEMMVGVSQTVAQGKTQDFEYLRLEPRPEGVFYVDIPSGKKETPFRFASKTRDGESEIFTFENPVDEFPQRIIYRRGTEGWLYAQIEGTLNGQPRRVIYPMRRVDCVTGEFIRK